MAEASAGIQLPGVESVIMTHLENAEEILKYSTTGRC